MKRLTPKRNYDFVEERKKVECCCGRVEKEDERRKGDKVAEMGGRACINFNKPHSPTL